MSHELRTPLNAILGFAGTLLMKLPGPLTADQQKQLLVIKKERPAPAVSLINDLLDVAKIESARWRFIWVVLCREIIGHVIATLRPLAEGKKSASKPGFPNSRYTPRQTAGRSTRS